MRGRASRYGLERIEGSGGGWCAPSYVDGEVERDGSMIDEVWSGTGAYLLNVDREVDAIRPFLLTIRMFMVYGRGYREINVIWP
jgi:hypothetical protein